MESLLEPTPNPAWVLTSEGFDLLREAIYESRFSISNGLLGLRAGRAVSRGERWVVPHRAYVAGLFDIPGPEHPIPALVPARGVLSRIVLEFVDAISGISKVPSQAARSIG